MLESWGGCGLYTSFYGKHSNLKQKWPKNNDNTTLRHLMSNFHVAYSVQSRPRFCVIDTEYSILIPNEIMVESH